MRKLLIVDDSADLRDAMQRLLSFYDFIVHTATDSKTLVDQLELFKPDIIIIDVLLNGEDGRQICKDIRENPLNKEITILLFSASPKHLVNFQEYEADGVIEKPFGIKELIENIETAIQNRMKYLDKN
jgi:Response regulator containing a CheY-like receiver domain and an HTH DNA-binding domain